MTSSLVGSEMCIRDRFLPELTKVSEAAARDQGSKIGKAGVSEDLLVRDCLLYTSDAADDM
eukprot:6482564-Prorocentrum_lima.AAC.1